jgi:hypothetical protein
MAKPITWRTIAGPTFNNSAGGQAIDAFNLAGSGFLQGAEQLAETQKSIDQGYTRDAMREALRTGQVDPNLNPRADSAAIYEALLGKQKFDSDLKTAQVGRAETVANTASIEADTEAQEYLNSPEMQEFDRQIKQAEMNRAKAQTEVERRNANLRLQELNFLRETEGRKIKISKDTDFINNEVESLTNEFADQMLKDEFGLDATGTRDTTKDPNWVPPTNSEINELWEKARARAEGREGRRIIQGRYKGTTEGWKGSIFGELDARAQGIEDATTTRRIEEEDRLRKAGILSATYQTNGDYSRSVWRDGEVVPEEDEDLLEAQSLGNDREAIARLRTAGLKTDYSKDEKEVLGQVRDLFPTASMFTQIVKSFTVNGKLDEDNLRRAAAEGARALLIATQRRSNAAEIILTDADNPRTQVGRPPRTANDILSGQQRPGPNRRIRGGPNRGTQ